MVYLSAPAGGGFMLGPLDKPAKGPRAQSKKRRLVDVSADLPLEVDMMCDVILRYMLYDVIWYDMWYDM